METDSLNSCSTEIQILRDKVRKIPDFPKKGVIFYDIFSLLKEPSLHKTMFSMSESLIKTFINQSKAEINVVVGLESRGLLIGIVLADRLGIPFVPIRKQNKLPGTVYKINYCTEYSSDTMELQADSLNSDSKVLIVDDLLATGGSMKAAEDLISLTGGTTAGYFVVFEIESMKGRNKLNQPDSMIRVMEI